MGQELQDDADPEHVAQVYEQARRELVFKLNFEVIVGFIINYKLILF